VKKQLEILKERGLIAQESHAGKVADYLESGPKTFYVGFDPTGESLHVGHLAAIMAMYRLVKFGHKAICIIGGGTAMIGDPSDKTEMRKMMTKELLEGNRKALSKQMTKLLDLPDVTFLNNADWLLPLNYLEFMREYGVHFNVGELVKKDIYKERLEREEGLTVFELNYILLQSYDYLHLYRNYDCTIQLGGSDQWSNILGGVDLIRKTEQKEVYAITWPLIARSDGKKMGKSESGAVWLDKNKTSPYELYQYWINIPDADALKFLKVFTLLETEEIEKLVSENIINAKKVLAYEITKFVHGEVEAEIARETSEALFGGGKSNLENLETHEVDSEFIVNGKLNLVEFLTAKEILKSKREARDLIESGGVYIDDIAVKGQSVEIDKKEFLLRIGKKKYYKILVK
jgi:tyrosyl-tRNA synthetase